MHFNHANVVYGICEWRIRQSCIMDSSKVTSWEEVAQVGYGCVVLEKNLLVEKKGRWEEIRQRDR